MKKLVLLVCAVLAVGSEFVNAENAKMSKQEIRQAKKEARAEAEMEVYEAAKQALFDQNFILEADRVEFKKGQSKYVTPNTNFVSLINKKASVQLALTEAVVGQNGLGGITVEGDPLDVKVSEDDKGNVLLNMKVQGRGISAAVIARMIKGTNNCKVTVIPDFNGNRIAFSGKIRPVGYSNTYQGTSF